MAGFLASLLPGAISGIANIVEGISKQRPAGEVIASGLRGLAGQQATDFLPTSDEQQKLAKMPMKTIMDSTMQGSVPRSRLKRVPVVKKEEDLEDVLDDLDDKIDEKLEKEDETEEERLRGIVEQLELKAEEIDDFDESIKEEIKLKKEFLGGKKKRKRRRRRR